MPTVSTGANTIIEKVGTGGLVAEEHPATEQLQATTAYRYTGANPDNYINFNNETWRIIGVFDTDDGTGKLEKRIKIIRDSSIGNISWSSSGGNDWSKASLMTLLNSGAYYNRTGSYATNGLAEEAKNQIADAKWYLGGTADYESTSNGLASHWYSYERGTTVCSERPTSWTGKVGLMYPSDYGYATSGGNTTNREVCLTKRLYSWTDLECPTNDWLYVKNIEWTITPKSSFSKRVFVIDNQYTDGRSTLSDYNITYKEAVRPSIYLRSDIELSGKGTNAAPYEITD